MIGRVIVYFLAGIFLCEYTVAQDAIPLEKERHHRVVLKNDYVRVLDGHVAAHDTTPMHVHDANSVVVFLSRSVFGIEVPGQRPVITAVQAGDIRYSNYGDKPVSHIVWGQGGEPFHFYVIELGKHPHSVDSCSILKHRGLRFQWRKPVVTVYYWDAGKNERFPLPASSCAYFVIDLSGTYPFSFYPPGKAVTISGHAKGAARFLLLQIP